MIDNRQLSAAEQALEILNRRASSFQIVTIGRILGPLTAEIVRQALDLVQHHHPRLNSRIVGDLDNLRFETGAKKIPLRVVDRLHEEQWQETVIEELNAQINSYEVLLRAVLVRDPEPCEKSASYLIIAIHHAISDGLSSIQLYSELLTYCQKIASGEANAPVPLRALPSIDRLLPPSTKGFRGNLNRLLLLRRIQFQLFWHRPETLSFEKTVPIELRRCRLISRQLDAEFSQQLVKLCRQEKTTVQGALGAAMMFAAANIIRGEKKTDLQVSCQTAVDLRRRLQPAIDDRNMGVLATVITSFHRLSTRTSFWQLARHEKQQIEASLKRGDMFSAILMFRKNIESMLASPDRAGATVFLSNVGRVNIPRVYGQFELSEISFVPAQAVCGSILTAAVTTFEGKMFFNFPFSEPAISQETMETFVDSFLSCLADLIGFDSTA